MAKLVRALFGIDNGQGGIEYIYSHKKNTPSRMKKILLSGYSTDESVRELLNMGHADVINETLESSVFDIRDKGANKMHSSSLVMKHPYPHMSELEMFVWTGATVLAEWVYYWSNGVWYVSRVSQDPVTFAIICDFKPLQDED